VSNKVWLELGGERTARRPSSPTMAVIEEDVADDVELPYSWRQQRSKDGGEGLCGCNELK
jgi:hypothetical protein